jgi:hypothetical protein
MYRLDAATPASALAMAVNSANVTSPIAESPSFASQASVCNRDDAESDQQRPENHFDVVADFERRQVPALEEKRFKRPRRHHGRRTRRGSQPMRHEERRSGWR